MNEFSGKSVAVLGLGIEGVDAVKYLVSSGANVTVLDQKSESEIGDYISKISHLKFASRFGPTYLDHLDDYDTIFRSPGIKLSLPQLQTAKEKGVITTSSTKEFFRHCPSKIIGVTGTKGKGTTSSLIAAILKTSGIPVHLAGNIGTPMLSLLPQLIAQDWVVLELSSFQLQDLEQSPHISVVTNITVDHLDYHATRQEYREAKENILKFQAPHDFAVVNRDDPTSMQLVNQTPAQKYFYSLSPFSANGTYIKDGRIFFHKDNSKTIIGDVGKLKLRGQHNWSNTTAAITASLLAGADIDSIKQAVYNFPGLEHRLELVADINGVKYYNDSFGTTPETTIAAIKSFSEPIVLIVGGSEKGSDFTKLGEEISNSSVKAVIAIGQMTDRIRSSIEKAGVFHGQIITGLKSMPEIVATASQIADLGDVVLLSPAAASFDMFKNYKERGNLFKHEVTKLTDKT